MNLSAFRIATACFAIGGAVCASLFLGELAFLATHLGLFYAATAAPVLLGGAAFLYKSKVGIKKPWLGLSYWAIWSSCSTFFLLGLLWLRAAGLFPLGALLVLGAQLAGILFSCAPTPGRIRTVALPLLLAACGGCAQVAVLNLYFAGYR